MYTALLRQSPATGYRVAQTLGKPAANTYKALESLARKGAIIVDEGTNRVCRAVPADEWLGQLERQFLSRKKRAAEALAGLSTTSHDDRLYQLTSRTQVMERCRSMLRQSEHVVVMDIFPNLAAVLRDDIESAAARGIEIVIKTYESIRLRDVRVVVRPRGYEITDALPGETISLNRDGAEHLLAVMPPRGDSVHQAIWTGSAIVSYLLFNGLINEVSQAAAMAEFENDTTVEKLRRTFNGLRHLHPISSRGPVFQNLVARLGADAASVAAISPNDDAAGDHRSQQSHASKGDTR